MERTIFYSWQSDLPRNTNWSFIESSINTAIKELKILKPVPVELTYDRATREETGSPDITESIFDKISNSSVFVADISIVNKSWFNRKHRKTPNPNVLLELGFAARTLGWEKIICLYNTDYGDFESLPFDLRNRRIMSYALKDMNKPEVKKNLAKQIKSAVLEMHSKGILTDKILDFLKKEIDQEILSLVFNFTNFIYKREEKSNFLTDFENFRRLTHEEIVNILKERNILGFHLLKSYHEYEKKFHTFVTQAMSSPYYNREIMNALIDIYSWFASYDKMRSNFFSSLLIQQKMKLDDVYVIHSSEISHGDDYPDRYLLMKKTDENESKGTVLNFGDFFPGNVPNLTNIYSFNEEYLDKYADEIFLLIQSVNNWTSVTNNEMIVDFVKQFRIKKSDGDWL